jgi:Ser/Thr protein kinase RdoA (MazF antagonist)
VFVLEAFGIRHQTASVTPLTNTWETTNVFRVYDTSTNSGLVLKRWIGSASHHRLKKEIQIMQALAASQFTEAAHALSTPSGDWWVIEEPDTFWSAQEYLGGSKVTTADPQFGEALGRLLGRLHSLTSHLQSVGPDRLSQLPLLLQTMEEGGFGQSVQVQALYEGLQHSVVPHIDLLTSLPRVVLHGDCNFENCLLFKGTIKLIDFEFNRTDLRLFDLAALVAPQRDQSGEFQLTDDAFVTSVIRAYREIVDPYAPITENELKLFPQIAMLHFLFVAIDLLQAGSSRYQSALRAAYQVMMRYGLQDRLLDSV